ncbi:hypothetical protein IE53DRAFT_90478 [Violaceomyces palustris]|uniref:Uncharacterized protein n=1 Tax=Violaceomyces palustris TaxID=1673888 RepID=A0ACD0P747_9BASI|nr:hypothetical protein IE53DRAFT_90478 [Violaceomyces palustris]
MTADLLPSLPLSLLILYSGHMATTRVSVLVKQIKSFLLFLLLFFFRMTYLLPPFSSHLFPYPRINLFFSMVR